MKIYPVNNLMQVRQVVNPNRDNAVSVKVSDNQSGIGILPAYKPLIRFCGDSGKLKSQLIELNGVHCPGCGVAMPNGENFNKLVNEAYKNRTFPEYAKFLTENRKYFQKQFQPFISAMSGMSKDNPELPLDDAIRILRSGTSRLIIKRMKSEGEYLDGIMKSENFTENDKQKVSEAAEYLKSTTLLPKYRDFCDKMGNTLGVLEHHKRNEIYSSLEGIYDGFKCRGALVYNPEKNNGLPERVFIVQNMLSRSRNNLVKVIVTRDDDNCYNNMLLCSDCLPKYKSFKYIEKSPNAQAKVERYFLDVAKAVENNKLTGNNTYLYDFIGAVNGVTSRRISLNRHSVAGVVQSKVFSESKTKYMFEKYEGIPCGTCGTVTITHNQKVNLYKQIQRCENLHELKNIVVINREHIVPKYIKIIDRFNRILGENPDITDEELMQKLREMSNKDVKNHFISVKNNLTDYMNSHKMTFIEKEYVKDFLYNLNNKYIENQKSVPFGYDEYSGLVDNSLKNISSIHKMNLIKIAKRNLKEFYMQDFIVNPPPQIVAQAGSLSKAMIQNILRMSVITVDHTEALSVGGEDEYYNKIGYCKDCNNEKSKKPFAAWVKKHPEIKMNLPKHFKYINEIIKEDNIAQMKDYPQKAAKHAMRLAKGRLDIPTDYNSKD